MVREHLSFAFTVQAVANSRVQAREGGQYGR